MNITLTKAPKLQQINYTLEDRPDDRITHTCAYTHSHKLSHFTSVTPQTPAEAFEVNYCLEDICVACKVIQR